MATPKIVFNQAGKPAGVADFSREDLALGIPVVASVEGGPFLQQFWTFRDKPIDRSIPAQSAASILTPTLASTTINNIDRPGTYSVQVVVNQGYGLGGREEDISRRTFYAGSVLNPTANLLPRRNPAYLERGEHNTQSDPIFGVLGNRRGWAQEMDAWFDVIRRHDTALSNVFTPFAKGRVTLTGGGASIGAGLNATVTRTGVGVVNVGFISNAPNANYIVLCNPRGPIGGGATPDLEAVSGFTMYRGDAFGSQVDSHFNFIVLITT